MLQHSTIRQMIFPSFCLPDNDIQNKANQLVSSKNADGKVTKYEYDAAGRMVKEGEKTFAYGWLDKVMQVAENGKTTQTYTYDMLGQLATADYGDSKETFLWDGLALLSRNNLKYVNEPAVTGGNPILAGDKMLFDDMLGNTLGVKDGEKFSAIDRDAFGELKPGEKPNLAVNFFTGKPEIDGLGYSFLFRNYRADLGKWQTTDPLGYPDGWNNLAYVNNGVTMNIDWLGGRIQYGSTMREKDQAKFWEVIKGMKNSETGSKTAQEIIKQLEDSNKTYTIQRVENDYYDGPQTQPNGTIVIDFDHPEKYKDGDGYTPDLAEQIIHEMVHAKQIDDGRYWDMSNDQREDEACKLQNQYLKDIGAERRRKYYKDRKLPSSVYE